MTSAGDIRKSIKSNSIKWVDLQFTDLFGALRSVTIPADDVDEASFKKGFEKLDGSSIRGFLEIEESDMVLMPIQKTFVGIPWQTGVARILNKVYYKSGEKRFESDPRYIAESTVKHLSGLGYNSFFGPELEFFLFDKLSLDVSNPISGTGYRIDSSESPLSNNGDAIGYKLGYYPVTPRDKTYNTRLAIANVLSDNFGISVEAVHHEVATSGQCEITYRFSEMLDAADSLQTVKYVIRNIAAKNGQVAVFMPKPFTGDNGSGLHTNFSLWGTKDRKNLFYDGADKYAELSQLGRYAVGGILEHARALSAIVSPTTNSYRRLVPGYEAPVYVAWGKSNRSAVIRIPSYSRKNAKTKRIEYRAPDPTSNPYLSFSAVAMAALDGIKRKIDPGDPLDENIYHMTKSRRNELKIRELPGSLETAVEELKSDSDFLLKTFPKAMVEKYIDLKSEETREINSYPSPIEFYHYLNI